MTEKYIHLSIFISLLLRHKPEIVGLTLDNQGWLNVDDLIDGINNHGKHYIDREILDDIVNSDYKQRYSYDENKTKIRANQGHSISVDLGLLECQPPSHLYHGTNEKFIDNIMKEGLSKQKRSHIHLSDNIETARVVGSRRGKPVILSINSEKMWKDGYEFYLSENGIWLTEEVPVKYIQEVNNNIN